MLGFRPFRAVDSLGCFDPGRCAGLMGYVPRWGVGVGFPRFGAGDGFVWVCLVGMGLLTGGWGVVIVRDVYCV